MAKEVAVHAEWGTVVVLAYQQEGRSAIVEARHGQRILLPTNELRPTESSAEVGKEAKYGRLDEFWG